MLLPKHERCRLPALWRRRSLLEETMTRQVLRSDLEHRRFGHGGNQAANWTNDGNMEKMDRLWKLKTCKVKTRLKYWNAIIKTKLIYALHTVALTEPQKSKLRAFQLKGLRKVLGVKTTYVNRRNTNNRVYQLAESVLNDEYKEEHRENETKRQEEAKVEESGQVQRYQP